MNSRELMKAALTGEEVPRVPTGPLAVHFCARFAGVTLRQYTLDPVVLARSVVNYSRRFRPDAVWVSADTWVNAQAMGAEVGFIDENQPAGGTGQPCIRTVADLDRIPPPNPQVQGRWPLMLEALKRIREELGNEVFIVACFDQYPFSLASELMGLNQMMLAVVEEPDFVKHVMARCLEYTAAYALALAHAGADMLSGGDSPAGLLGPRLYRAIAQPFEKRLIERIKAETELPVSLHICGDAMPILTDMMEAGADVLEIDYPVPIDQAFKMVDAKVALWGNLDPVGLLAQGTPTTVYQKTIELLHCVRRSGARRFVLSSGCTLAVETPEENLDAFFAAAHDFDKSSGCT